jgi:hypothetical protein
VDQSGEQPHYRPAVKRTVPPFFRVCLVFLLFLGSCGIEDYLYLYPVSPGNIWVELNTLAEINLPDIDLDDYYYFNYFTLYYRIYVSDIPVSGTIQLSRTALSRINPALYNDYAALEPYTNNESSVSTSVASLFRNRNYYPLALQSAAIEDVLASNSLGKILRLDFAQTPGTYPSLQIIGPSGVARYVLYRSTGGGVFSPRPNRYFLNAADLSRNDYLNTNFNADTARNSSMYGSDRHTYVSIYIVVTGIDMNISPIYSRPTHVGIFRLPDPN